MAFQIVDDVLDVIATDEQLGKPAGHDLVEGAYNLPVLRALAGPSGEELRAVLGTPIEGEAWNRARTLVRESDGIDESVEVAGQYVTKAIDLLAPLEDRPAAVALQGASRHLLDTLAAVRG
jgi:heptaprenyl diphosphate synthase